MVELQLTEDSGAKSLEKSSGKEQYLSRLWADKRGRERRCCGKERTFGEGEEEVGEEVAATGTKATARHAYSLINCSRSR